LAERGQGILNNLIKDAPLVVGHSLGITPEEEDKVVEALEELRINYNLRQWRVCSLICDSLADKFRDMAKTTESKG
jgi:hypothetical protein